MANHEVKSLIDTRKRKRGERSRSRSREAQRRLTRPSLDLGAILRGSHIPENKYRAIQDVMLKQDRLILARDQDIKDLTSRVDELKDHLADGNASIDPEHRDIVGRNKTIAGLQNDIYSMKVSAGKERAENTAVTLDLQERNQALEMKVQQQNELMEIGRTVLAEKREQFEKCTTENQQLRTTIGDRDKTISSLNDTILRISMSHPEEAAKIGMETQAQRHLNMVKGLQADVAQHAKAAASASVRCKQLENANESLKALKEKLTRQSEDGNRKALTDANAKLKSEVDQLREEVTEKDKKLRAAASKAAEATSISDDQARLINKLLDENARLAGNQKS